MTVIARNNCKDAPQSQTTAKCIGCKPIAEKQRIEYQRLLYQAHFVQMLPTNIGKAQKNKKEDLDHQHFIEHGSYLTSIRFQILVTEASKEDNYFNKKETYKHNDINKT